MSNSASSLVAALHDFFCLGKKFLVYNLVGRNLKVKYHRSIFGIFWTVLAPLMMALTYFFVFQGIMKIRVPNYLVFILSGVLPWGFFSQSILESMESIVGNVGLVTKIPVPLQIFPYVGTITNLVTLAFAIPILLAAGALYHIYPGVQTLLLPFYLGALFILAYCFGLILSIAFVFFRDLRHLMGIFMQLWFFGTPVLYEESMIPARFSWIIDLNPIGHIFIGFHTILARGTLPTLRGLAITTAWTLAVAGFTLTFMRKHQAGVVEQI